jgi:replication-associated recombination protein RarA
MQKAIRRGDVKLAGYFAIELWKSGYGAYAFNRLLTISAEDCAGIVTTEIFCLALSHDRVNKRTTKENRQGRVFLSKAVIILCEALKNRDADHLTNFVYDRKFWISDEMIEEYFNEVRRDNDKESMPIPDYALDVHTRRGKILGKTKVDFVKEEIAALVPKDPDSMFDAMADEITDW